MINQQELHYEVANGINEYRNSFNKIMLRKGVGINKRGLGEQL